MSICSMPDAGPVPATTRVAVTTYLPEQIADGLVAVANAMGISRSELLRRLAEDLLAGRDITGAAA